MVYLHKRFVYRGKDLRRINYTFWISWWKKNLPRVIRNNSLCFNLEFFSLHTNWNANSRIQVPNSDCRIYILKTITVTSRTHARIHIYIYVCVCVCVCVRAYTCVCVCWLYRYLPQDIYDRSKTIIFWNIDISDKCMHMHIRVFADQC